MINTFIISIIVQAIFFVFARYFTSDKVTDLSYSLTFICIALYNLIVGATSMTTLLLSAMIIVWALRLGLYLFIRILTIKKDTRFDGIRENFLAFAKFWFLQGVSVWLITLPFSVTSATSSRGITILQWSGVVIWAVGLIIESIADWQKFSFYQNKGKYQTDWIEHGLWAYSRHPNYFGEMLVWWGVFIVAVPLLQGFLWLSIVGPVYITGLLLFVTGIPPLEKMMYEKYGGDSRYQLYLETTSMLIPLPKATR